MGWFRRSGLLLALGLVLALGLSQTRGLATGSDQQVILPPLQAHPFPPSLAAWRTTELRALPPSSPSPTTEPPGDYFEQIQPTEVGYLVWSQFPITVYIDPPNVPEAQAWMAAAQQAVAEWQAYLPLELVTQAETADITIQATRPIERPGQRVRAAETSYELYIDSENHLAHRCTVIVRPTQVPKFVLATLRHELGHALGIWGHSPVATDALYFAQVAEPPLISARDVQTLIQVYQQPTRLGWPLPANSAKLSGFRLQVLKD